MKELLKRAGNAVDRHLGRCSRCMRQAFLVMLGTMGLALGLPLITDMPAALLASEIAAAGAAILWLSHLTAFALRSAAAASPHQPKRRYALAFVRDLLVVAAATAVPLRAAFAQKACRCGSGMKCCYNYSGNDYVCAPSNAVCCAGNPPHYCPSGKNCYGSSGCR
jgi:energy-converting hydrogenase Eha subunit E